MCFTPPGMIPCLFPKQYLGTLSDNRCFKLWIYNKCVSHPRNDTVLVSQILFTDPLRSPMH